MGEGQVAPGLGWVGSPSCSMELSVPCPCTEQVCGTARAQQPSLLKCYYKSLLVENTFLVPNVPDPH